MKSEKEVSQLCLTLSDPMDCSPPGSSVHWIFLARVLEWGAIAFSTDGLLLLLSHWDSPGKNTGVGCHFLLQCIKVKSESEVTQLCPTLCDPIDSSLPGSSVHGIFQARVLEWVAIAFSAIV